jgi:hypothetical protein
MVSHTPPAEGKGICVGHSGILPHKEITVIVQQGFGISTRYLPVEPGLRLEGLGRIEVLFHIIPETETGFHRDNA